MVLCVFCNTFFFHTIKSVDARYFCGVERLLYALGAGRQGRVNCELQHQSHSPCAGTLSFCPDTTAHQTCAGLRQMNCIYFRVNGGTIATIHFLLIRSTDVHIVSGVISDSNLVPL